MRIIFMGTPELAVVPLEKLCCSHHQVIAVVTQPDRPAGRGRKVHQSPVKEFALTQGIQVFEPQRIRGTDFHQQLQKLDPEVIIVCAYGKILPPELLEVPKYGCINIHLSLLPKYRGAAPVQWAIIKGEETTGVTIMKMNEGMDAGNIIAQRESQILDDDDTISVTNILICEGSQLLLEVLERLECDGTVPETPQDESQVTYAPKLKKEDGRLDWAMTNEQIICCIKGLYPWPGAYSYLGERKITLLRAEPWLVWKEELGKTGEKVAPGTVGAIIKHAGFAVRTGDGYLLITRVKPEGRPEMTGVDCVNGGYVRLGTRFS